MPIGVRQVAAMGGLVFAALLNVSPGAQADTGVDALVFKPTLGPGGGFAWDSVHTASRGDFGLRMGAGFVQTPVSLDSLPDEPGDESAFDYAFQLDLAFHFGLTDRLTLMAGAPLMVQPLAAGYGTDARYLPVETELLRPGTGYFSSRPDQNIDPSSSPVGDVRVGLRYALERKGTWGVQGVVYVPFGDEDVFAGSSSFTFEPKLLWEKKFGQTGRLGANLGARLREQADVVIHELDASRAEVRDRRGNPVELSLLSVGSEALAAVGFSMDLTRRIGVGAEGQALLPILSSDACADRDGCVSRDIGVHVAVGGVLRATSATQFRFGAGYGLPSNARSQGFQLLASLEWIPGRALDARSQADSDGDGIPDVSDACPDEPEDLDGTDDEDGCPELDNDLDGIPDVDDACPDEPEDKDGKNDQDGCPETDDDSDGDGILDDVDQCPDQAEDQDGFQDDDGCPEDDNDGDGILDRDDKCPFEPETVNGYEDLDGCPDQNQLTGPRLTENRVDLQGARVDFRARTTRLTPEAIRLLDDVASVLIAPANSAIRVRLEVHVEASGSSAATRRQDQSLTEQRGRVIESYLISKGVSPARLSVAAFGSSRLINPSRPRDAAFNRRVDFILQR